LAITNFVKVGFPANGREQRLSVFEKRMLRGKFGFKKEDRADWLKP
jgi:hypothetical protein